MPHWTKLRVTHPFSQSDFEFPDYHQRIDDNLTMRRPTIILIDGKSQTGKSELARMVCSEYDPDYKRFFTVDELLDYLSEIAKKCEFIRDKNGKLIDVRVPPEYMRRWYLFDEVQMESPDEDRYKNRNKVLVSIAGGFGFLLPGFIMTLPDLTGISRKLYKNITFRISTMSKLNRNREIERTAFIKLAIYDDNKNRYFWRTVEINKIPFIKESEDRRIYHAEKTHNFFVTQLDKWRGEMKMDYSGSGKEESVNKHFEDKKREREDAEKKELGLL